MSLRPESQVRTFRDTVRTRGYDGLTPISVARAEAIETVLSWTLRETSLAHDEFIAAWIREKNDGGEPVACH